MKNVSSDYHFKFPFESNFKYQDALQFMENKWYYCFPICSIYVLAIFSAQKYMENKKKYNLKRALILWDSALAIFSLVGAARTIPEFWDSITNHGLYHSVCDISFFTGDQVTVFWAYIFAWSKFLELGDTVFIILRKQPLIFLHWYHHVTVLLYTWYNFTRFESTGRWFVTMNYTVHSIMYTYYALRALGYRLQIQKMITLLQLIQMVFGSGVTIWAYYLINKGIPCSVSPFNLQLSLTMYGTYFALFGQFFYNAYIAKPKSIKTNKSQ